MEMLSRKGNIRNCLLASFWPCGQVKRDAYQLVLGSFWSWRRREPLVLPWVGPLAEEAEIRPILLKDMVMRV